MAANLAARQSATGVGTVAGMPELELTRADGDRRLFALEGVGTLRLKGWASRAATAEAAGVSWEFNRVGVIKQTIQAADAAGSVIGRFEPNGLKRGGKVAWQSSEFELRPASRWKERYALADGDRELALLDGKGSGGRPVKVAVEETIDPELLLFATFVVRGLAEDAGTTTVAAGT